MPNERADHEDRIRVSAYHLWENDGRPDGQENGYWERAEKLCECEDVGRIQDVGKLITNNFKLLTPFMNATGEPDALPHLEYKV